VNTDRRRWPSNLARVAAPVALLFFAAFVLAVFPPTQYSFYPQCPIHRYFHILCPGCGTTRAIAALLHGNIVAALQFNALTTLLLPVALAYAAISYRRYLKRMTFQWPQPSHAAIYTTLIVVAVFTIARNL